MKICNEKFLDANSYDQIVIRSMGDTQIDVHGDEEKYPTIVVGNPFSKTLNGLNNEEVIFKVTERFLNCTEIRGFSWLRFLPQCDQYFAVISGNNRLLALQPENHSKGEDLISLIWHKYDRDRRKFLENQSDIKLYAIDNDNYESFYRRNDYFNVESNIEINLSRLSVDAMEQRFLKDFINDKIKSSDSEVCIKQEEFYRWPEDDYLSYVNTIRVGDTLIELSNSVVPDVQNILDEFNDNLRKQKKMQLKLEGF